VETFTTNLSLEKVLANSLRDIESALDRLAKGTYGTCKYCGNQIDERRLLARPASSACVTCKENFKSQK
jgi:DnaK suppressor protein